MQLLLYISGIVFPICISICRFFVVNKNSLFVVAVDFGFPCASVKACMEPLLSWMNTSSVKFSLIIMTSVIVVSVTGVIVILMKVA